MKITTKEKNIEHPLEEVFNLEPASTVVEYKEILPEPPIQHVEYDQKDLAIESQLEEVYATAMSKVVMITDEMERVEGKYKARIGEVTASMLNVALGAIREKRELKQHKDKISTVELKNIKSVTNNNNVLVVSDRNELLRALKDMKRINVDET